MAKSIKKASAEMETYAFEILHIARRFMGVEEVGEYLFCSGATISQIIINKCISAEKVHHVFHRLLPGLDQLISKYQMDIDHVRDLLNKSEKTE